jgi:PIN domain nuclease of toxin-antitoxin system
VILLDTHIWVWWVHGSERLGAAALELLLQREKAGDLSISVISCWEVAKLVERGRLTLPLPVESWLERALAYPGLRLLELTPRIIVESTQLPDFHRDPADQLIVATARVLRCPLATVDRRILSYAGVDTIDTDRIGSQAS